MSVVHKNTLPDVDHEGTSELGETTDGAIGLKVKGGAHRENSESRSSSVEVIPESSVESCRMFPFNNNLMTQPKHKETEETSLDKEQNMTPQFLQSNTLVPILTPPTDDKKPCDTLDLRPDTTKMKIPDYISIYQCTEFIFKLCKDELQYIGNSLGHLTDWTDPITLVGCLGSPCRRSDDHNRETGITLQHGKQPEDSSNSLVILDTVCKPEESEGGVMKMSQFFVYCYIPMIFWILEEDVACQRICQAYMDIRENVRETEAQKGLPKPDIHIVYEKRRKCGNEQWQCDFLQKVKDIPYCHVHIIQMNENPAWATMTSQQREQFYHHQLQEMELEILSKCKPLSIGGALLNGRRFTHLLEICLDEINSSGTDTVDRFLANTTQELSLLTDKLTKKYATLLRQTTDNVLPILENVLEREHVKLCEIIMAEFSREALLTNDYIDKATHGLQANMQEIYQQIIEQNKKLSAEKCQLLVEHCFREILTKLDAAIYDTDSPDYQKDLSQAIDKYKNTPGKGPQADSVLISFMKSLATRRQKNNPDNGEPPSIPGAGNNNGTLLLNDEKSDPPQHSISTSMEGVLLRDPQGRKNVGEASVRIYSQVFALEQRNAELEEQIKRLLAEYNRLKTTVADTPGIRHTYPEKSLQDLASPVRSLSPQDTQWIHVEKQQENSQKEAICVCKEITEREVKLQNQNKKLKEKITELAEANGSWEKHCETIQDGFTKQVSGLLDELHESKRVIRKLESEAENQEEAKAQIEREAQKRVLEAEEQKTKAISFASAQAEKVDELKRHLRKEKKHTEELEQRIQELQAQLAAVTVTMEEARSMTRDRRQEVDVPQTSPRLPEELIHLSIDNRPPPSRDEHQQNSYRSHVTSVWESIPPSLLVEPPPANPCCQRLQQRLSQSETEIRVLQQQVTIYKDDFEKERQDRENAHSEIASLQSSCLQLTQDIKVLQDRLTQKAREAEALKHTRTQEQYQLREKQDYIERLERSERTKNTRIVELQAQVERLKRQQYHVPQQPPPPYTEVPRPTANGPVNTPEEHSWEAMLMPPAWKRQLEKHYVTFANHMKPSEVINHMYARALISYHEKVRLDAMDIDYKKVEYLFHNIVMKLTRPELLTFKQILTDNNQAALARLLPSEDYTGPSWDCPRCTFKNPANLARCHMCQKRAPGVEPLGGIGAVEQCDGDDAEWVQPASIIPDTDTEEGRAMDSIDSSEEDTRSDTA